MTEKHTNHGPVVGILGGTGLYELEGLTDVREVPVETPFGLPSDPPIVGRLGERTIAFVPRHGRGHRFLPSEVNFRANVHALKQLGAQWLISVSAVGSMKEEIHPGDFVLVDQLIDRTHGRASTFFGNGCVGHVAFADPVCSKLTGVVATAAEKVGFERASGGAGDKRVRRLHVGGTYLCMEGPQFSSRAESNLHRSWGVSVIGMTAATEAKLAREAELCFSLVALATDYDCWHPEEESVTASAVMDVLKANGANARALVREAVLRIPNERTCACGRAAEHAFLTARDRIAPAARERLATLYGKYLG